MMLSTETEQSLSDSSFDIFNEFYIKRYLSKCLVFAQSMNDHFQSTVKDFFTNKVMLIVIFKEQK